jgi:hypothetical protein
VRETTFFVKQEKPGDAGELPRNLVLYTDRFLSTVNIAELDIELKILFGALMELGSINGSRCNISLERVIVEVMNITSSEPRYLAYKEYALRCLGEHVIGKGSYAFILPRGARSLHLYLYVSKTGRLFVFDPEKERPNHPDQGQVKYSGVSASNFL